MISLSKTQCVFNGQLKPLAKVSIMGVVFTVFNLHTYKYLRSVSLENVSFDMLLMTFSCRNLRKVTQKVC